MDIMQSSAYTWNEIRTYIPEIKAKAVQQCLSWYEKVRDLPSFNQLLWGDETEYSLVVFDAEKKQVKLSLSMHEVLERIRQAESEKKMSEIDGVTWFSEFTNYMIEGIPAKPYEATIEGLLQVEPLMKSRKSTIRKYFRKNEKLITMSSFFRLGVDEFSSPYYPPKNIEREGISDLVIAPFPRYHHQINNITSRRGCLYRFKVPIYRQIVTNGSNSTITETNRNVTLDHPVYGPGCCCLQVTFQAVDMKEALYLHDQTAVLAPLLLALTAATPIFKGYLCERDCRWDIVSHSIDDRTDAERKFKRTRYASIPSYYSTRKEFKPEYNDEDVSHDEGVYKILAGHGMEEPLARFFANVFSYDPLYIPKPQNKSDNKKDSYEELEYMLAATYPTIRLKTPPIDHSMGWRIEFRTMELQANDFENAAFSVVMNLLVRTILHFQLNLLIPISKNDDNMKRAQLRDAARQQKFWFRKDVLPSGTKENGNHRNGNHQNGNHQNGNRRNGNHQNGNHHNGNSNIDNEYTLLSLNQIFNGEPGVHCGLIPLLHQYLDEQNLRIETRQKLNQYIDLVQNKANGTKLTTAQLIREFVLNHPNYKNDSYVDDLISYDLVNSYF